MKEANNDPNTPRLAVQSGRVPSVNGCSRCRALLNAERSGLYRQPMEPERTPAMLSAVLIAGALAVVAVVVVWAAAR